MNSKICTCCKIERDFSAYHKDKQKSDGIACVCKFCKKSSLAKTINKYRKMNEHNFTSACSELKCSDCKLVKNIIEFNKNRCCKVGYTNICSLCRKIRHISFKKEVLNVYGGCFCTCCGEEDITVLTIDHIHNNGDHERKSIAGATAIYNSLRKRGYPKGFQVLCYNCNIAKYRNNGILPQWRIGINKKNA